MACPSVPRLRKVQALSTSLSIGGFSFLQPVPATDTALGARAVQPQRERERPTEAERAGASGRPTDGNRRAADNQLAELASGLATNRLSAAADRLSAADRPDAAPVSTEARAALRTDVQRRGSEFIAVSGGASTLNGTRSGAAAPTPEQETAARQQLLDFVRANGTADQARQAEALFRGEVESNGRSGTATGGTTGTNGATQSGSTQPANSQSATPPAGTTPDPRLERDRQALARLTELNSSLRQGLAFGGATRGSVVNFFT